MPSASLRLFDLCPVDCHPAKATFVVPAPGAPAASFVFTTEDYRHFYAIQPKNHDLTPGAEPEFNPSVAIVGLSAAENQIADFIEEYRYQSSYDKAARSCCFKGLVEDLIAMLGATGAAKQLGLKFAVRHTFDGHPDILCDSLVKCASKTDEGSSTDWNPSAYVLSTHCVLRRFIPSMLNPAYTRLKTILILGSKGWDAVNSIKVGPEADALTAYQTLVNAGKRVQWFPHPSGENGEYVALAKRTWFPTMEQFQTEQYEKYVAKRKKSGKPMKRTEAQYKGKAGTIWNGVAELRQKFA